MSAVLATVGVPPVTVTAPPLTRILPAASRLMVIVLSCASPKTVRMLALGRKVAVTAGVIRSVRGSKVGRNRPSQGFCRIGRRLKRLLSAIFQSNRNMVCPPKRVDQVAAGRPPRCRCHCAEPWREPAAPARGNRRPCWHCGLARDVGSSRRLIAAEERGGRERPASAHKKGG